MDKPQVPAPLTPAQLDQLERFAKLLRAAALGLEQSARLLDRRLVLPRPTSAAAPSLN